MSTEQYWFMVFYVLVLAITLGAVLISKVPPLLQTPLMSGSNAISGITLVGAILATAYAASVGNLVLVTLGVALATINVVGGYAVSNRMLRMFKSRQSQQKEQSNR